MSEGYLYRGLSISQDIGDVDSVFKCLVSLAGVKLSKGNTEEAFNHLLWSIDKTEEMRSFLKDNDQFKISFSDVRDIPYQVLSALFCFTGNPNNALYVLELARARALADLMATQYSVESEISANPQSWVGIEDIMKKESNCVCLYTSYFEQDTFLWILKTSGVLHFRPITVNENIAGAGSDEESLEDLRLVEDDDEEIENPESSLSLCYRMLIAPVADLLERPEIIIVPDRSLNKVPFVALHDEGGKYLSESFRIRIVPSLSTLKLIQDSPADYHSQTGALIVGDPVVGWVLYKGCR
ncbi:hypothetical protein ACROYT_G000419 [Oculina patagonica]